MNHRPLNAIAADIRKCWLRPNYAAKPYLEAMAQLRSVNDMFGYDTAASVLRYFLSNATSWRGADAQRIKAEIKSILKAAGK